MKMNIKELDDKLDKITQDFAIEIQLKYDEVTNKPAGEADICELARQTFYALDDYRKAIIEYLSK